MTDRRLTAEEKRFMAWLEKEMVHDCSFALHPLDSNVEYCQFCGVLREATLAQPGGSYD